jgi:hypothetical protein
MKTFALALLLSAAANAQTESNAETQEHLVQQTDCITALFAQPSINELMITLGTQQKRLTIGQMTNDAHATAKDSVAAIAFLDGITACIGQPPNMHIAQIWCGFANGILTYGDTSVALYNARLAMN